VPLPQKRALFAGEIRVHFPLNIPIFSTEHPHRLHWASPSFPLGIPIFSTGHPHLFHWASPSFPLGIPIFSTGRPHRLHWPSPSSPLAALICSEQRWAYGRPKKHGHLQHFFSLPYRRLYLSTAETRWCFSIEHPHLFHWASPSFPLSIPIFSTGRPRILRFPCEIRVTSSLTTLLLRASGATRSFTRPSCTRALTRIRPSKNCYLPSDDSTPQMISTL
jgi:hypothetical protein